MKIRAFALAAVLAGLLVPAAARADLEPLFKAAKLAYQKSGDRYTVYVNTGPNRTKRVLVFENQLGSLPIKYVRVIAVAAQLPKGPPSATVAKAITGLTSKLTIGRATVIEETEASFAVYQTEFFAEGASPQQLSLAVELSALMVDQVEKVVSTAANEG